MPSFKKYSRLPFLVLSGLAGGVLLFELLFAAWPYFYGKVVTPFLPDSGNFYIYVFGSSTPYGEPYGPKISFPKILSSMYGGVFNGRKIVIKNFALSGDTVEKQYWRLYKELVFHPRGESALFIYSGLNDIAPNEDHAFAEWKILQGSAVMSLIMYLRPETFAGILHYSKIICRCLPEAYSDLPVNSKKKYRFRLEKTIKLSRAYGFKTFISTLVGNYSDCPPGNADTLSVPEFLNLMKKASAAERSGNYIEAADIYEGIAGNRSFPRAQALYRLAKCYATQKKFGLARRYLYEAADLDNAGLRPMSYQNKAIRSLAEENGAVLVDTFAAFEEASEGGLVGNNLIIDTMHPNLGGYIIMAGAFSGALAKEYGLVCRPALPDENTVLKEFDFTAADMLDVYTTRAKWLMAAYNDKYHPEQLIRVADYIKRSEALQSSFGDQGSLLQLYFVKLMFAAINYDAKGALCWLDKGRFLKENSSMICVKNNDFYEFWLTNYLLKLDLPADIKAQLSKIVANRPGSGYSKKKNNSRETRNRKK